MSDQEMAPRRRAAEGTNRAEPLSRRQLLAVGAAAATVATLPALAGASPTTVDVGGRGSADLTDEKQRLAAVINRYGPELGPGR